MEITVRCGCTRTMTPDACAGFGRYRCGCGARIAVSGLPKVGANRCSLVRQGRICNGPKDPEAPTCEPCALRIARYSLRDTSTARQLAADLEQSEFAKAREAERQRIREEAQAESEARQQRFEAQDKARKYCVVYYCLIQPGVVKIGTSTNLRTRITTLRRDRADVLAAEPGSFKTETMRHRQFSAQRIHPVREDFRLDAALQAHIDNIARIHGDPYELVDTIVARQRRLAEAQPQS